MPLAPSCTRLTLQSLSVRMSAQSRARKGKRALGLLLRDAVDGEAALVVVEQAEELARLLNRDDVHEASRVGRVGANLAVDLDETLGDDQSDLSSRQRILQAVAKEDLSLP